MIKLIRDQCSPLGTLGIIEEFHIYTLERPWVPVTAGSLKNLIEGLPPCGQKGISCLPPGIYHLEKHDTEAHPKTFALINPELWVYHWDSDVPPAQKGYARTTALIHPANWVEELRGCIAPGMYRSTSGAPMVSSSRRAFDYLYETLAIPGQQIEIVNG